VTRPPVPRFAAPAFRYRWPIDVNQNTVRIAPPLYRLAICFDIFGAMHLFYLFDIDAGQFLFLPML
jgi:hypothetical protein